MSSFSASEDDHGATKSEVEEVAEKIGGVQIVSTPSTNESETSTSITTEKGKKDEKKGHDDAGLRRGFDNTKGNEEGLKSLQKLKDMLQDQVTFSSESYILREGHLTKHSGDKESKYYFVLTNEQLIYCHEKSKLLGGIVLEHRGTLLLTATLVEELSTPYMIKILSKTKSFYVSSL